MGLTGLDGQQISLSEWSHTNQYNPRNRNDIQHFVENAVRPKQPHAPTLTLTQTKFSLLSYWEFKY